MAKENGKDFMTEKDGVFRDLWRKVDLLVRKGGYDAARHEINRELFLLAQISDGGADEELRKLKEEFWAYMPEEARLLLNPETPESRNRQPKGRAANIAEDAGGGEEIPGFSQERPLTAEDDVQEKPGSGPKAESSDVLALEQITPGLMLEIEDKRTHRSRLFEVLSVPKRGGDGNLWISVCDQEGKMCTGSACRKWGLRRFTAQALANTGAKGIARYGGIEKRGPKSRQRCRKNCFFQTI